jgi:hypothetical protein
MSIQQIEVITRTGQAGETFPVSFSWQGNTYTVQDIGRRWTDLQGEHILVLTPQKRTYELIYSINRVGWFLNIDKVAPLSI